jgi:hypothetical protein
MMNYFSIISYSEIVADLELLVKKRDVERKEAFLNISQHTKLTMIWVKHWGENNHPATTEGAHFSKNWIKSGQKRSRRRKKSSSTNF